MAQFLYVKDYLGAGAVKAGIFYHLLREHLERLDPAAIGLARKAPLSENFITREGYQDLEMSCTDVILYCQLARAHGCSVHFEYFGSDSNEELVGKLATFNGSRRVCNGVNVQRLLTSMRRIDFHRSAGGEGGAPAIPRRTTISDTWQSRDPPEDGEPYDTQDIPGWAEVPAIAEEALQWAHKVLEQLDIAAPHANMAVATHDPAREAQVVARPKLPG